MSTLKDKTAVVTGSTSGIGLACARVAGAGTNVMLNGIGAPADVEKTRSAIENDSGVKAMYPPATEAALMIPAAFASSKSYSDLKMPTIILAGEDNRLIDINEQSVKLHDGVEP